VKKDHLQHELRQQLDIAVSELLSLAARVNYLEAKYPQERDGAEKLGYSCPPDLLDPRLKALKPKPLGTAL
jgi:hypothetical protein